MLSLKTQCGGGGGGVGGGGGGGGRRRSRGSYFPYILLNENPSERNPNNVFTTGKAISNGVASGVVH